MTSTELTVLTDSQKQLLALAEQGSFTGTSGGGSLPFKKLLMVNEMGLETPEGTPVPQGSFYIPDTELFDSKITLRPLAIANKLVTRLGQDEDFKVDGETVYFMDWNQERIDSKGGVSLGRLFGKAAKELSPEEAEINKEKAGLYLHVFGIATIKDTEELVLLSLRGGKYGRVSSVMMNKKALNNTQPMQLNFKLELVLPSKDPELSVKERKEAKNTYFNLLCIPIMTEVLPIAPVIAQLETILNYIAAHDSRINEKHRLARQNTAGDTSSEDGGDVYDAEFEEVEAAMAELG